MKKLIITWFLSLLLLGCSKPDFSFNLNTNDIIEIKYNNITIIPEDYTNIINIINSMTFKKENINDISDNQLIIKTNNDIYKFTIYNSNYIKYENGKDSVFSANTLKLSNNLIDIKNKYTSNDFYKIEYLNNYIPNDNDLFIKLDPYNNLLKLHVSQPVYNFQIHAIEQIDGNYIDTNLLYNVDSISINSNIIIRKTINRELPNIRISFETQYGYIASIIPKYNNQEEEFIYIEEFKAK